VQKNILHLFKDGMASEDRHRKLIKHHPQPSLNVPEQAAATAGAFIQLTVLKIVS
jgi:hypothetical protein